MHLSWIVGGSALAVFGAVIALVCNAGRHSQRYLSRAVRSQNRFRRAVRAPSVEPTHYVRGIKAGLIFGIGMGALLVVLGVATIIRGLA